MAATSSEPPAATFKILLIGDSGTGKSSLLLRFTDDTFLDDEMTSTIGVDFKVKYIQLPNRGGRIKLTIWDTAGQERFRTLTSSYYRGANGVILVYDVSRRESFQAITETWFPELDTYTPSTGVITMIVGNKVDKLEERAVTKEEGLELAKNRGALFMECSAKSCVGVQQAFQELCQKIWETPSLWQKSAESGGVSISANGATDSAGVCSC